jgi:hypothetical protein
MIKIFSRTQCAMLSLLTKKSGSRRKHALLPAPDKLGQLEMKSSEKASQVLPQNVMRWSSSAMRSHINAQAFLVEFSKSCAADTSALRLRQIFMDFRLLKLSSPFENSS